VNDVTYYVHTRHLGGGGGVFPGITLLLFWLLLIMVILLVWRALAGRSTTMSARPGPRPEGWTRPAHADGAEQLLAERLARGEIDVDEYRQRLDALRASQPPPPPPPQ
jgi:putative membrane protein